MLQWTKLDPQSCPVQKRLPASRGAARGDDRLWRILDPQTACAAGGRAPRRFRPSPCAPLRAGRATDLDPYVLKHTLVVGPASDVAGNTANRSRSEEHTSELQSQS